MAYSCYISYFIQGRKIKYMGYLTLELYQLWKTITQIVTRIRTGEWEEIQKSINEEALQAAVEITFRTWVETCTRKPRYIPFSTLYFGTVRTWMLTTMCDETVAIDRST